MAEKKNSKLKGAYRYCGDGVGVPGLPQVITAEDAEASGLDNLLQAAVEAGTFEPTTKTTKKDGD